MANEQDDTSKYERAAREAASKVYGNGTRVEVSRSGNGGQVRVLDKDGKFLNSWYWDVTSLSQNT